MWPVCSSRPPPVICRVGSLENICYKAQEQGYVICRVGSLEMRQCVTLKNGLVICRVGSLETYAVSFLDKLIVICRVGSLGILRQGNADVKLLSIALANWAVLLLCAPIYFLVLP